MAIKILSLIPNGGLTTDGYISAVTLVNSTITWEVTFLDTNHQSGGVNANNRVSVVAFEVTPQPGAGLAPIGIDNGGSVVYQSIPGATFTGIAPTTQEEIEPPTSNTPGIYRVTWESSSQSISNNGDFYRVKLTNGLSGETITSEIHYSDGAALVPGVYDDEYYKDLSAQFPEGLGPAGDPSNFADNNFDSYFADIGPRQVVVNAQPELVSVAENYNPSYIVSTGSTVTVSAAASYTNLTVSSPAAVSNIVITWQKSYNYDPSTGSGTWENITLPSSVAGEADYAEVTAGGQSGPYIYAVTADGDQYAQRSTLEISNIDAGANNLYFRPVYFGPSAPINTIISQNPFRLIVDPQITIISQPGQAANNTKNTAFCYGQGNASNGVYTSDSGGDIRITISAVSSVGGGSTLNYNWQYRIFDDGHDGTDQTEVTASGWTGLSQGGVGANNYFSIVQGTSTADTQVLLRRTEYYDRYQFRCLVTGSTGENQVISDTHEIYMRDNRSWPTAFNDQGSAAYTITTNEDFYGNVTDRRLLTLYPIRTAAFTSNLEVSNYRGIQGNVSLQWQRSNDNGSTWFDVGNPDQTITSFRTDGDAGNPDPGSILYQIGYTTPPLKIGQNSELVNQNDNNSRYRIRLTSSSYYTFNPGGDRLDPSTMKTLIPWYSTDTGFGYYGTLSLFREIFIIGEPSTTEVFIPNIAAFEVTAAATSEASGLRYQWQVSTAVNNAPSTWSNLSSGPLFGVSGQNVVSGQNTTTLTISNTTIAIDKTRFFRCIVSFDASVNPGALASVTSQPAQVRVIPDRFDRITTIDDKFVDEFQDVEWTVEATTLSLATITFQWQRSYNYGSLFQNATWSDLTSGTQVNGGTITGASSVGNTSTLSIGGVRSAVDKGYYRLKMTSLGGIVAYSNVVYLGVSSVDIIFTKNFATSLTFIEDSVVSPAFEVSAYATTGLDVSYRWEYQKVGDTSFTAFALGQNNEPATSNPYQPIPFNKDANWDGAQIRAAAIIPSLTKYSNIATIDVRRRFYYYADTAVRTVSIGTAFSLDLRPSWTGLTTPTYEWEYSANSGSTWQSVNNLGAVNNLEVLYIANVLSSYDGYLFRCKVSLPLVDDFIYSRNNVGFVDTTNPDGTTISVVGYGYTENIELNAISAPIYPVYASAETGKTGCAVGTVICIPKPPGYVNNNDTAVADDISSWGCAQSGDPFSTGNVTSVVTSGAIFDQNRSYLNRGYSWIDTNTYLFNSALGEVRNTFRLPKWLQVDDRFPGFIELRGQWLLRSEFPLLYEIIGDEYGTSGTGVNFKFKLPNPYSKKIMGTGAINSQTGRTSVVPLFDANGNSGGDRLIPGTIGGVYLYEKSRQLPPGSPNVSGQPDGTAGSPDPATFTLGTYRTDGWQDAQGITFTNFVGNFTFRVGPLGGALVASPPPHQHVGVAISAQQARASSNCERSSFISPSFYGVDYGGGELLQGPEYIGGDERGITHTHGLSDDSAQSGNNYTLNHGTGKGDVGTGDTYTNSININFIPGSTDPTLNVFLEFADVTMSIASRNKFDNALKFYVRNSEPIPIISNYFRVKWMIKAY